MSASASLLDAARCYAAAGLSVVPAKLETKAPALPAWKQYQRQIADLATLRDFFSNGHADALALVCGRVSGGLEDLDFDAFKHGMPELWDAWRDLVENLAPGLLERLVIVETQSRNRGVLYRCAAVAGNLKLALRRNANGGAETLIETRGEGGICLVPPSAGYRVLQGDLAAIPTITPEERAILLDAARSLNLAPDDAPGWTASGPAADGRPGDDYNERGDVIPLLERRGWAVIHRRGDVLYLRRPGKERGSISATWNYVPRRFYVFSTNASPFDAGRAYQPFQVYALLEHGGDFAAAARSLAADGYGKPTKPMTTTERRQALAEGVGAEAAGALVEEITPIHNTDLGNARRLVARFGADIRYCWPWARWLIWTGTRWQVDDAGEVYRLAKRTIASMYAEAAEIADDNERQALIKHALSSERHPRIVAMLELAKSEPGIPILPDQLDADDWLLPVENGVIDLRSGELLPHRRENLNTKTAPVQWDDSATCARWLTFLNEIMDNDADLVSFLRRAVGYTLTGSPREQCMFILYGTGANGKSTFLHVISTILGDYARQTPVESFLIKRSDSIPNDIAALRGARMVTAAEVEQGRRLAEGLVKRLTGGDVDKVSARFMRAEWFDYVPKFKIYLATNHKPDIRGADNAIWRRIRLIPFNVTIPPAMQDRELPRKLLAEASGILRWAVEGCLEWQRDGLGLPRAVEDATAAYRAECDRLATFLDERCIEQPTATARAAELYRAYLAWCEQNNERAMSSRNFSRALLERGFERRRDERSIFYVGIGICAE